MQTGSVMHAFVKTLCLGMGLGLGLASATAPALADDAAAAIFGERQLAMAVDTRCGLFTQSQRTALDAARLQARGLCCAKASPACAGRLYPRAAKPGRRHRLQ